MSKFTTNFDVGVGTTGSLTSGLTRALSENVKKRVSKDKSIQILQGIASIGLFVMGILETGGRALRVIPAFIHGLYTRVQKPLTRHVGVFKDYQNAKYHTRAAVNSLSAAFFNIVNPFYMVITGGEDIFQTKLPVKYFTSPQPDYLS